MRDEEGGMKEEIFFPTPTYLIPHSLNKEKELGE